MSTPTGESEPPVLVYDHDCPMCRTWCCNAFPEGNGEVVLADARKGGALMDEITAAGLDIDRGMVLKKDGRLHYGADAIREAALLSRRRGVMASLNRLLFAHKGRADALYPFLRDVRNALLRVAGIPFIRNLEKRP